MGDMVKAPFHFNSYDRKKPLLLMIISKQRIINEYQNTYSCRSSHEHAMRTVAQLLGVAEQLVADTIAESQAQDAMQPA